MRHALPCMRPCMPHPPAAHASRSPLHHTAPPLPARAARSRGKWAAGFYDPACDDDYEWDDDHRPYGRSCASRPPQYLDKCCSEKNP